MDTRKTIILVLVRYYLPGFKAGGPVRSISNIVAKLGDEFDFRIITSDRDLLDRVPYVDVVVDAWNQVGKAQVFYLSPRSRSLLTIFKLLSDTPHDILYFNSFFDPIFTLMPLLGRFFGVLPIKPALIATRGELSPGALLLKRRKKVLYIWVTSAIGLYRNLNWHASTHTESMNIQNIVSPKNISTVPIIAMDLPIDNDPTIKSSDSHTRKLGDPLRIVFLSRIVQMKNLDFALKVLAKVTIPINFHIFGPIEDESYWMKCNDLIADLPLNISVHYEGEVEHLKVLSVLKNHDLFFLPTRGENFGHVIMESMIVGTPVLIADTTPWRNLEQNGVGWELPLDNEQKFADKIHDAAQFSNEAYRIWRKRVESFALEISKNQEIVASNRNLFIKLH